MTRRCPLWVSWQKFVQNHVALPWAMKSGTFVSQIRSSWRCCSSNFTREHCPACISKKMQCLCAYWLLPHYEIMMPRLTATESDRVIGRLVVGDPPTSHGRQCFRRSCFRISRSWFLWHPFQLTETTRDARGEHRRFWGWINERRRA